MFQGIYATGMQKREGDLFFEQEAYIYSAERMFLEYYPVRLHGWNKNRKGMIPVMEL